MVVHHDQDQVIFDTGVDVAYYLLWAGRESNNGVAYTESQFQSCSTLSSRAAS